MSPPAHASLFTGLHPDRHGVLLKESILPPAVPTMAEILARAGYRTWCISNKLDVGFETALDRGFERVVEMRRRWIRPLAGIRFRFKRSTMNLNGRLDEGASASNRKLLRWLDRERGDGRPFFAFINYADAHYPYGAPRPYRYRFTEARFSYRKTRKLFLASLSAEAYSEGAFTLDEGEMEALSDLFDGGLAYLDSKVGELVDGIRQRGLLENTIVAVLADHGEYLGDRGWQGHGLGLYEPVLRIPLIMRWPARLPEGLVEKRPVQISDLLPTLLALADVNWEGARDLDGVSLLPLGGGAPYHQDLLAHYPGQVMIRHGSMKYLRREDGADEVYDLSVDHEESENLVSEKPDTVQFLRARLEAFLSRRERPAAIGGVKP
jgi:arylsulfatase A-like enzyme